MQVDPIEEWRRLREHYIQLNDEELYELALDFADLTEPAQNVLRDEMRTRGLDDPQAPREVSSFAAGLISQQLAPHGGRPSPADTSQAEDQETDLPHEYTWKTPLCGCEDLAQAQALSEGLRRAGIESWIERPGARRRVAWDERMGGNLQVLVAADQLDRAREVAAKPIPQNLIDEYREDPQEFEPPTCPKCGAGDPVLEGVDPVNSWLCEACGNQWTESADDADAEVPVKK
jgi:hypothetical protein